MNFDFPDGIGEKKCYLMYHEELESLVRNLKGIRRARFWMTFSDNYLNHLKVLGNVGMTRIDPVNYNGQEIIPIQFLKADQGQNLHRLPHAGGQGRSGQERLCVQHLRP